VDDKQILERINELATKEKDLFKKQADGEVSDDERKQLKKIEVTLDQCWDLLHQRRARRSAGMNPDEAEVRDAGTVEGYVG
jgi:hypothetical protein